MPWTTPLTHPTLVVISWLLTYLLHSTLLLGCAFTLTSWMGRRYRAAQQTIWKAALVGGLLTATLQLTSGIEPIAGSMKLSYAAHPGPSVQAPVPDSELSRPVPTTKNTALASPTATAHSTSTRVQKTNSVSFLTLPPMVERTGAGRPTSQWAFLSLLMAWGAGALFLALSLSSGYLRLARALRGRRAVEDEALLLTLRKLRRQLRRDRSVLLTSHHSLKVPIARGFFNPEICIPSRVTRDLTTRQQETLLAHELAHLDQFDPVWLGLARWIEALLLVQPLNRLARRRLQELFELRCDDWAVQKTGRPRSLASCLTEVAGWTIHEPALPAVGLADSRSGLSLRVRRLLATEQRAQPGRRPRWLIPATVAILALAYCVVPGFHTSAKAAHTDPALQPTAALPAPILTVPSIAAPRPPVASVAAASPRPEINPKPAIAPIPEPAAAPDPAATPGPSPITAPDPGPVPAPRPVTAPAQQPAEPSNQDAADRAPESRDTEAIDDPWIEDRVEEILDAAEDRLDEAEESWEDEIETYEEKFEEGFEQIEESLESEIEKIEDRFDEDLDRLDDEIDALEDRAERRFEGWQGENREEAFDRDLDDFEDRLEAITDDLEERLEEIEDEFDAAIDRHFEGDLEAQIQESAREFESRIHEKEAELHRLARDTFRKLEADGLDEEQIEKLRSESQRLAAEAYPSAAELETLRRDLEMLTAEATISTAELETLQAELRQRLAAWQADSEEAIERIQADFKEMSQRYD